MHINVTSRACSTTNIIMLLMWQNTAFFSAKLATTEVVLTVETSNYSHLMRHHSFVHWQSYLVTTKRHELLWPKPSNYDQLLHGVLSSRPLVTKKNWSCSHAVYKNLWYSLPNQSVWSIFFGVYFEVHFMTKTEFIHVFCVFSLGP